MKNIILLTVCCLVSLPVLNAQDLSLSQQFDNPIYLNPALSGSGSKMNRALFHYRDQWRKIPATFSSTFISYDRKLFMDDLQTIGGGVQILHDRLGKGQISTTKFSISPSYSRKFKDGKYTASIGLQVGVISRSIDNEGLLFEDQFQGFDINPSSEEPLVGSIGVDLGIGADVKTFIGDKNHRLSVGFAINNLGRPNLSLIENGTDKRPIRMNYYATSEVNLSKGWSINPVLHLQFQEKSNDIFPLVYAKKYIEKKIKNDEISDLEDFEEPISVRKMAFSAGAGYRISDAAIVYLAWELNDLKVGFNADLNTSRLKDGTNASGAFEFLVRYEFGEKREKPEPVITYDTLFILDTISIDTILIQEEEIITQETEVIQEINRGLAVSMYFPNDYPNPNSRDTVTDMTYTEVYKYYEGLTSKHPILAEFIEEFVIPDQKRYNALLEDLISILESGKLVSLDIRGYASSLATSDYNLNLSKRRVDAVVNDFKANTKILKFINNGMLRINRLPYGDTQAEDGIDDSTDLVKSVYGKKASRERRVEIESIKID